ncbi:MAG: hypothetical protein AB8B55_02850 [Mariniblastus sp.]
MKFKTITAVCLISTVALLAGCSSDLQQANSNQKNASQKSDSASHPKLSLHKPKELSAAIQRVSQLHESLMASGDFPSPVKIPYVEVIHGEGAAGHSHFYSEADYEATEGNTAHDGYPGEHHEEDEKVKHHTMEIDVRTELTDIAGWLPDIAAKSNLNEADWNSVKSLSSSFTKVISEIAPDASDASFRESWKLKSKEIEAMLDDFGELVDSSGAKK